MTTITNILDVEQHIKPGEAVIFDLDDTLYSEKAYVRSGYAKIAAAFGRPEMAGELWQAFEAGKPAIDVVLARHHLSERKQEALGIYRTQMPDIQLYRGVRPMLERLHRNHKMGLITDGRPEGQRAKIRALKIADLFDRIIITDELGGIAFRKPNPEAFRRMLAEFGAVSTTTCSKEEMPSPEGSEIPEASETSEAPKAAAVYIGDNLRKDFIAPQELGMRCIYFRNADGLYVS